MLIFVVLIMLVSCSTTSNINISSQNSSFLYNKQGSVFRPVFSIFHFSDDSSKVYFSFNTNDLLAGNKEAVKNLVEYRVSYKILNSIDEGKLIDSTSFPIFRDAVGTMVSRNFNFHSAKLNTALMIVKITDINKKVDYQFYLSIDKSNKQTRQFFKVNVANNPTKIVSINDSLNIIYYNRGISTLSASYYHRKFEIADPPYAFDKTEPFNYSTDSTFTINLNYPLYLAKEGFYHFQINKDDKQGLTLFKFNENFPIINSASQLLEPLRYLTTQREYDALNKNPNPKIAVDNFWLQLGGDDIRSRELLRKYYSRVIDANKLFTSFKEGWKTDRGMIYIIYGVPNIVYKTSNSESWVYGEDNNVRSLNFNFVKVNNPFTDNDYSLNRTPVYQTTWNTAIDIWRNGRAYNDAY
jgi:GWxTD domain-containing protein